MTKTSNFIKSFIEFISPVARFKAVIEQELVSGDRRLLNGLGGDLRTHLKGLLEYNLKALKPIDFHLSQTTVTSPYNIAGVVDVLFHVHVFRWLQQNDYLKVLIRKCNTLVYKDDYGDLVLDKWDSEVANFANNKLGEFIGFISNDINPEILHLIPRVDKAEASLWYRLFVQSPDFESPESVLAEILHEVVLYSTDNVESSELIRDLNTITDPYDYEVAIAEVLRSLGMEAYATQGSGDQGADVIASLGDFKYVIQAKLYSNPVGNKAVQEVAAAKGYYNANQALVVTNNTFTPSARTLANSLNVGLLHHDQLVEFFMPREKETDLF